MEKNLNAHISDRTHMNITLNVYDCGNRDVEIDRLSRADFYMFCFVKDGAGTIRQYDTVHTVKTGCCFVAFPHEEIIIQSERGKKLNLTWVTFSGYLVDVYLMRAKITAYAPVAADGEDHALEMMFDSLLHDATRASNRYCPIMSQMYRIFAYLLDHVAQDIHLQTAPPAMYLMKALDYIDIFYQKDITVEDVARNVGLNRKALYTIFKKLTGFSTKDYLIYYRMRKATILLAETNLPIEVIAASVGYRDQFHFSKEFKKNVGNSPSGYRRLVAKNPENGYVSPIDDVRQYYPSLTDHHTKRY